MSTILRRYSGPGVLALVGLGFDLGTFTGSSIAAYAVWGMALLWAIYASLPWLRRLRFRSPFAVVPRHGPAVADSRQKQEAGEVERLRRDVESLTAQRDSLQEEVKTRDADREMYRDLLMAALKEGLQLRESNPGKEAAQEWPSHLHKLLEAAEGEWRVKPFRRPTPGYAYADLGATGEQAFMDYQLAKLQDLIRLVESRQTIKFRSGFDPHEWKDWKTPPGDELKRRCAELAKELTKFLDAWESFRDQPKIYPDKPGDWPRYTMEEYRRKNFERRLATLLDDLERNELLTTEARARFKVPTDDPQTIREVVARLSSICDRG